MSLHRKQILDYLFDAMLQGENLSESFIRCTLYSTCWRILTQLYQTADKSIGYIATDLAKGTGSLVIICGGDGRLIQVRNDWEQALYQLQLPRCVQRLKFPFSKMTMQKLSPPYTH